jgi:hypothetical protein
MTEVSPETERIVKSMRSYRARESFAGANFEILRKLPVPQSIDATRTLILFGSRDVPEIVSACKELERESRAIEINQGLHADMFLLEETFQQIAKNLRTWFGQ